MWFTQEREPVEHVKQRAIDFLEWLNKRQVQHMTDILSHTPPLNLSRAMCASMTHGVADRLVPLCVCASVCVLCVCSVQQEQCIAVVTHSSFLRHLFMQFGADQVAGDKVHDIES